MNIHVGARHPVFVPGHVSREHVRKVLQGIWRVADPKITLASLASMTIGGAAAAADGPIAWGWLVITVLGIMSLEAAKNASGEIFDLESDAAVRDDERSPFSGGKRVIVDGLMTKRETALMAAVFYGLGCGAGLAIAALREPMVLVLGMIGVALAFFYNAPPLKLAYRGLGELAVGASYGPLIACGTYLVQRHAVTPHVVLASLPLGLAIAAFLVVNELPDARADALAGKKNLVVRLGAARAGDVFGLMHAATYAILALLPLFGLSYAVWLGFAGLPLALRATARVRSAPSIDTLVPAQAWTLLAFVLLAVGTGVGLLAGPHLAL
ncbi:prenyltransferase [Myxococcota bacterium]|nr:prenyltransferase [Myxococcota bacterium]